MRPILICVLVVVAILATVAVNPSSSWVLKNQLDMLTQSRVKVGDPSADTPSEAEPDWLFNPKTYDSNTPEQQLAKAFFAGYAEEQESLWQHLQKHPNDPVACTMVIRVCFQKVWGTPDNKLHGEPNSISRGIQACDLGERLEPENVYFPLMKAVFRMHQRNFAKMTQALADAAGKTQYNSHIRDKQVALDRAALQAKGYRGEIIRMAIQSRDFTPELGNLSFFAQYLNRQGTLAQKRDAICALRLMTQNEEEVFGLFVAWEAIRDLCTDKVLNKNGGNVPQLSDDAWLTIADSFDRRLEAAKLPPIPGGTRSALDGSKEFTIATHQYFANRNNADEQVGQQGNWKSALGLGLAVPITALASLLIMIPFVLTALGVVRIPADLVRPVAPHVGLGLACLLIHFASQNCCGEDESIVPEMFGLCLLMVGALQLPKRPSLYLITGTGLVGLMLATKTPGSALNMAVILIASATCLYGSLRFKEISRLGIAKWGSWALVLITTMLHNSLMLWGVFAYVIVSLLMITRKDGSTPAVSAALSVILAIVVLALTGFLSCQRVVVEANPGLAALIGEIGATFSALLLIGRKFSTARIAVCTALTTCGLAYLCGVGLQVSQNQRLIQANIALPNDANSIRALMHSPKK